MSKTCGDTARYHRIRIQKIKNRARIRVLRAEIEARKAAIGAPVEKPAA
jgi:hypothetical protein